MSIEINALNKHFGSFHALKNVNLRFETGELTALLGPSGCGKTTLLRMIAGLEQPDQGQILLHGEETGDRSIRERQIGFVFQHYALFRHMSVFDNVAFGLRMKPKKHRPSKDQIAKKVHALLELVQLDWLADRFPSQLSGGQRQRIALARALAVEPSVLLLDEPFGALDAQVRKELRRWLRTLHDELHITSIFVTHDQEEALEVADRVVLMNQGRVEQIGTPEEVYAHPATAFVYGFLGSVNLFHGRSQEHEIHTDHGSVALSPSHALSPLNSEGEATDAHASGHPASAALKPGQEVLAFARPHDIRISTDLTEAGIRAQITRILSFGLQSRIELDSLPEDPPRHFEVLMTYDELQAQPLEKGQVVTLHPKVIRVFDAHTQQPTPLPVTNTVLTAQNPSTSSHLSANNHGANP